MNRWQAELATLKKKKKKRNGNSVTRTYSLTIKQPQNGILYLFDMTRFNVLLLQLLCMSTFSYVAFLKYLFIPQLSFFWCLLGGGMFTGIWDLQGYVIFLIFAQIIDCGYSLELPCRGGSNGYQQSMF